MEQPVARLKQVMRCFSLAKPVRAAIASILSSVLARQSFTVSILRARMAAAIDIPRTSRNRRSARRRDTFRCLTTSSTPMPLSAFASMNARARTTSAPPEDTGAAVYVELESGSTWKLAGDSFVTSLTCDADAIDLNGFVLSVGDATYAAGTASTGEAIEFTVSSGGVIGGAPDGMPGEPPDGGQGGPGGEPPSGGPGNGEEPPAKPEGSN